MSNEFKKEIKEVFDKYEQKKSEYGETWKTIDMEYLNDRLVDEMAEYHHAQTYRDADNELTDVILLALMIKNLSKEFQEEGGLEDEREW